MLPYENWNKKQYECLWMYLKKYALLIVIKVFYKYIMIKIDKHLYIQNYPYYQFLIVKYWSSVR